MTPPTNREIAWACAEVEAGGVAGPWTPELDGGIYRLPQVEAGIKRLGVPVTAMNVALVIYGLNLGIRIGEARAKRSGAAS
jgi:hypothetical protein